ncbi:hypothetical protein AAZX31_17G242200 [Glycine max]
MPLIFEREVLFLPLFSGASSSSVLRRRCLFILFCPTVLLLPVFSVGGWLVRRGPWLLLWCFCLLRGCCSFGLLDRLRG